MNHGVESAIDGFAKGHNISASWLGLAHHIVLAGFEGRVLVEGLACIVENVRHRRTSAENKPQAWILIDTLHAGCELMLIDREVKPRGVFAMAGFDSAI